MKLRIHCCRMCGAIYIGYRDSVCPNQKLWGARAHALVGFAR